MLLTIEQLLEMRFELALLAGSTRADFTLVMDNQVLDYSEPFPKYFIFDGLQGMIDNGYVCWAGMGVHLESIGGYALRKAIKDQTGY